jgi:serine/threonine protein kinase
MAEIFRARTTTQGFDKRVCIKRILPHFLADQEFVTMFRDEARTAAKLQHANVVQVFDFGTEEGTLYLAMELVDGADLRRIMDASRKKHLPLHLGEAVQIAIDMCRGLHHAHTLVENGRPLGLVHRDVSPHNVLVSRAGEVKLTDFGIAKAAERATQTSTGIVKGKVAYMAPEQAQGFELDHRLDQFATGIVLWEMLAGARLFTGDGDAVILKKILACDVPPPSSIRQEVPPALDDLVLRALAEQPRDRFADVRQMELALSRFLFSGAIDPDTAEVRSVFPRIMSDAEHAPRKTQVATSAPLPQSTGTSADLDPVRETESFAKVAAPRPSSDAVSAVFASSEKVAPAPGPMALAVGSHGIDPNAVTVMEVSDENARALSERPPLPSVAELDRLDGESNDMRPAPDATPATRTNVPRAASATFTTSSLSLTPTAVAPPATDRVAAPRPRALRTVAAGVSIAAAAAILAWVLGRPGDPGVMPPPPSAVVVAAPAMTPPIPEPVVAAALPAPEGATERVLETKPIVEERPAPRTKKMARVVPVFLRTSRGWFYLVMPDGITRVEIQTEKTRVLLPEGKGKFRVTRDDKSAVVALDVIENAVLTLPAL